jgi:hypothetical protein
MEEHVQKSRDKNIMVPWGAAINFVEQNWQNKSRASRKKGI